MSSFANTLEIGVAHHRAGRLREAAAAYRQVLAADPRNVAANNNLGTVLQLAGDLSAAIACYGRALEANPDCADTYINLGNAYQEQGQFDAALDCYDRCLNVHGDAPEAHFNRGLIYLSQGRLAAGWPEFAWRLKCPHYPHRRVARPLWDGRPFAGQTLLVHAEQGFGDTLHFVRFLPAVRRLGGNVVLEVQQELVRLLHDSGFPEAVAAGSPLPRIDLDVPLMQLPGIFRVGLEELGAGVPYLQAEPTLVESWRDRLADVAGFKVGIVWQGNRRYAQDSRRSIPLAHFAPLARVDGVRLFGLQTGDGREQLAETAGRWQVTDLGAQFRGGADSFLDAAAVIKNLDLVISSDTAIAHLAGALGAPVWVALCDVPEWRWFCEREDSPWYPTMRLYRQSRRGDWAEVFERMSAQLRQIVSKPSP